MTEGQVRLKNWLLVAVVAAAACVSRDEKADRAPDADTPDPVVFGYLFGGRFYPLVLLDAAGFDTVRIADITLAGRDAHELADPTRVTRLGAETTYVDEYAHDKPGRFSAAAPLPSGVVVFASFGPGAESYRFRSDTAAIRSFYRFFSRDFWGQHFFKRVSPDAPLQTVADKSRIRAQGITDVDNDGHPELWLTYQLMYGEIGAMVWERTPDGWEMVSYHCFRCD